VIVSPFLLKEYNKRWFLFAFNHEEKKISTFALDRILDVRKSLQDYHRYPYNDIIGVSIPEEGQVEEVRLAVYGEVETAMGRKFDANYYSQILPLFRKRPY